MRLQKQYGPGRSRKLKGTVTVRPAAGRTCKVEVHWYEAYGVSKKKMKHSSLKCQSYQAVQQMESRIKTLLPTPKSS